MYCGAEGDNAPETESPKTDSGRTRAEGPPGHGDQPPEPTQNAHMRTSSVLEMAARGEAVNQRLAAVREVIFNVRASICQGAGEAGK